MTAHKDSAVPQNAKRPGYEHRVYLALGSNLGDRQANLAAALQRLCDFVPIEHVSSLYETEPVGYDDQPCFLNIACSGTTRLTERELLMAVKGIEHAMGRQPTVRNGPRLIDVDILLYDRVVMAEWDLIIPHPRMRERAFVLVPLVEIAPTVVDPVTGLTIQELAHVLPHSGVTKHPTQW